MSEGVSVVTEQELEQRLLAACNRLRGPVDPTDYKAYRSLQQLRCEGVSDHRRDWTLRGAQGQVFLMAIDDTDVRICVG